VRQEEREHATHTHKWRENIFYIRENSMDRDNAFYIERNTLCIERTHSISREHIIYRENTL
jgi:hypothetical protein